MKISCNFAVPGLLHRLLAAGNSHFSRFFGRRARRGLAGSLFFSLFAGIVAASPLQAAADSADPFASVCAPYDKSSVMIAMRDGVKLYTEIFRPKHASASTAILLVRTPYMAGEPEGKCSPRFAGIFSDVRDDGYILVRQSIRGRAKSQGTFVLGSPLTHFAHPGTTDEATDAWDTVAWLVKNVPGNNGKVALLGISYDAMLAVMAATDPNPAVAAISTQASPGDFWIGDDFWRNGAFRLNYGFEYAARMEMSKVQEPFPFGNADTFEWYLKLGSLRNVNKDYFHGQSEFWNNEEIHRTHDDYWQARNLSQYLSKVRIPVLSTGGWWDAEDFYGSMTIAKGLEHNGLDPSKYHLVVGPWTHGGWTLPPTITGHKLAQLDFGADTAVYWRHNVERPWLAHLLLGKPDPNLPAALSFRTGVNQWMRYAAWPPKTARNVLDLYLACDGTIGFVRASTPCRASYVSDPSNPVPYLPRPIGPLYGGKTFGGTAYHSPWPEWQVQDQRFASHRPDTLLFATAPLKEDVVLTGEAALTLHVATTGTDGDFIVKLMDIYPGIVPGHPELGGYHLMINHAIIAARYLKGFASPAPLVPGHVYELTFHFTGNDHAFQKGHQIAVQVQSSLFPVIARNPHTYVDDIFAAKDSDYQSARIDLVSGPDGANVLAIPRN